MSTITKEWLQQKIADMEAARDEIPFGLDEDDSNTLAAMKLALASLEAEAVAFVMADDLKDSSIISTPAYRDLGEAMERTVGDVVALYAAPPASVTVPKVPSSVTAETCNLDEPGHDWNEAEYYAQGWNACRDAMIQGAENAGSPTTMKTAPALDSSPKIAESTSGNSPVIPDWQTQAEKMAELYGSSFVLFRNGESPQCADPSKVIISFTDEGIGQGSAAPQQEVE